MTAPADHQKVLIVDFGQTEIDLRQGVGPVREGGQVGAAVADAAQAHHRHAEPGSGAEDGEGLHVDHVGVNGVIAGAGDDAGAGGQPRGRESGRTLGQRQDGGDAGERRLASGEAEDAGIHVAIADGGDPIDAGVVEGG